MWGVAEWQAAVYPSFTPIHKKHLFHARQKLASYPRPDFKSHTSKDMVNI